MANESDTFSVPGHGVRAAWPDLFANLQDAYARVIDAQFELEQRAAELEESRDLLRQVIASMSEALFLLDRTGRVVQVNPAALQLIDRDEADSLGRLFTTICPAPDAPTSAWKILNQSPRGVVADLETSFRSRDGAAIAVSLTASVVRNRDGRIDGVLVVAEDVQSVREQQARLIRSGKQQAFQALASGLTRELSSPLVAVRGYLQHLLQTCRVGDTIDQQTRDDLQRAEEAAARISKIAAYLQEFARPVRGAFGPLDVNRLAKSSLLLAGAQRESDGPAVVGDFQDALPLVQGNWHDLADMLLETIEAMKQTVADWTATLRLSTWAENGRVYLKLTATPAVSRPSLKAEVEIDDWVMDIIVQHGGQMDVMRENGPSLSVRLSLPALEEQDG